MSAVVSRSVVKWCEHRVSSKFWNLFFSFVDTCLMKQLYLSLHLNRAYLIDKTPKFSFDHAALLVQGATIVFH